MKPLFPLCEIVYKYILYIMWLKVTPLTLRHRCFTNGMGLIGWDDVTQTEGYDYVTITKRDTSYLCSMLIGDWHDNLAHLGRLANNPTNYRSLTSYYSC